MLWNIIHIEHPKHVVWDFFLEILRPDILSDTETGAVTVA